MHIPRSRLTDHTDQHTDGEFITQYGSTLGDVACLLQTTWRNDRACLGLTDHIDVRILPLGWIITGRKALWKLLYPC
ncbi:MAG: hypothetical protein ACOVLK_05925, partial [Terrimicrobiaceae bacterium]